MPVPNPDFKPNWQEIYNDHQAESSRLGEEIAALREREGASYKDQVEDDSPEMTDVVSQIETLSTRRDEHDEQSRRCLDTYQHKTIQDAARWIFASFRVDSPTLIHVMDFENMRSMQDVRDAWKEALAFKQQAEAEQNNRLPVGKPDGQNIFEHGDTTSAWQVFSLNELFPGKPAWGKPLHTLVTTDTSNSKYHICFMQDPNLARSERLVETEIAHVATAVYKRAILSATEQKVAPEEPAGKLSGFLSLIINTAFGAPTKEAPDPSTFHFYVHHRPAHLQREKFYRVEMEFADDEFRNPNFIACNCIPERVQSAHAKLSAPKIIIDTLPERQLTAGEP
jgi:hypothetical protein